MHNCLGNFRGQSSDVKEKGQACSFHLEMRLPLQICAAIMIYYGKELHILFMPDTWCKVNSEMIFSTFVGRNLSRTSFKLKHGCY